MERAIAAVIVIVLLALCIPVTRNMTRYGMPATHAMCVPIMDCTSWAPGYSEEAFLSIGIGTSTGEVQEVLGPPLYTNALSNGLSWHYTTGPNGKPLSSSCGSTHVRAIHFFTNMTVSGKTYEFYFD